MTTDINIKHTDFITYISSNQKQKDYSFEPAYTSFLMMEYKNDNNEQTNKFQLSYADSVFNTLVNTIVSYVSMCTWEDLFSITETSTSDDIINVLNFIDNTGKVYGTDDYIAIYNLLEKLSNKGNFILKERSYYGEVKVYKISDGFILSGISQKLVNGTDNKKFGMPVVYNITLHWDITDEINPISIPVGSGALQLYNLYTL